MTAHAVSAIVERPRSVGLNQSLAPTGWLAVAPSGHLIDDLHALIPDSKALLVNWVNVANDASPPD